MAEEPSETLADHLPPTPEVPAERLTQRKKNSFSIRLEPIRNDVIHNEEIRNEAIHNETIMLDEIPPLEIHNEEIHNEPIVPIDVNP